MFIDILFLFALFFAIFNGYRRGLILALFSFVGYFIGLAAALKLSASVGNYFIKDGAEPAWWIPVVSFLIVFLVVVLLIHLIARAIRSFFKILTLGWFDRIGGILIFILIYFFILSILIFYANQLGWISDSVSASSKTYRYIEPVAPVMLEKTGRLIPFFANLFDSLKEFFGNIAMQQRL